MEEIVGHHRLTSLPTAVPKHYVRYWLFITHLALQLPSLPHVCTSSHISTQTCLQGCLGHGCLRFEDPGRAGPRKGGPCGDGFCPAYHFSP